MSDLTTTVMLPQSSNATNESHPSRKRVGVDLGDRKNKTKRACLVWNDGPVPTKEEIQSRYPINLILTTIPVECWRLIRDKVTEYGDQTAFFSTCKELFWTSRTIRREDSSNFVKLRMKYPGVSVSIDSEFPGAPSREQVCKMIADVYYGLPQDLPDPKSLTDPFALNAIMEIAILSGFNLYVEHYWSSWKNITQSSPGFSLRQYKLFLLRSWISCALGTSNFHVLRKLLSKLWKHYGCADIMLGYRCVLQLARFCLQTSEETEGIDLAEYSPISLRRSLPPQTTIALPNVTIYPMSHTDVISDTACNRRNLTKFASIVELLSIRKYLEVQEDGCGVNTGICQIIRCNTCMKDNLARSADAVLCAIRNRVNAKSGASSHLPINENQRLEDTLFIPKDSNSEWSKVETILHKEQKAFGFSHPPSYTTGFNYLRVQNDIPMLCDESQ